MAKVEILLGHQFAIHLILILQPQICLSFLPVNPFMQKVLGNMLSVQAQGLCWQECHNSYCTDLH